jgi:hypothetical protein
MSAPGEGGVRVADMLAPLLDTVVGQVAFIPRERGEALRLHYCLDHLDGGATNVERRELTGRDLEESPYVACAVCGAGILLVASNRR